MVCPWRLSQATVSLSLCSLIAIATTGLCTAASGRPELVLWAWDTPNDLTFLARPHGRQMQSVSVAAYGGTITVQGAQFQIKKYGKKLVIPDSVPSFPVIRIESIREAPDMSVVAPLVAAIVNMQKNYSRPSAKIQIDYDATTSERAFYRALLRRLKAKLKPGTQLSVTALASWCLEDRWLTKEECDEAVAMLFSMGPGQTNYLKLLDRSAGQLSAGDGIITAVGVSASESFTTARLKRAGVLEGRQTIYLFNSLPWQSDAFTRITGQKIASNI